MVVDSFMKNRQIHGEKVVLVPYCHIHVSKYNNWMQDDDLQYLTASEPLTLDQEYDMLKTWTNDPRKCTFIILDKITFDITKDQVESMIGDVNIFIDSHDDDQAEIEVMIAEKSHRAQGKGKEAVLMMIRFASEVIGVKTFIAKIKYDNINSQNMFLNLGFNETSKSDVFKEIQYNLAINNESFGIIKTKTSIFDYHLL